METVLEDGSIPTGDTEVGKYESSNKDIEWTEGSAGKQEMIDTETEHEETSTNGGSVPTAHQTEGTKADWREEEADQSEAGSRKRQRLKSVVGDNK